jgi:hypothetical protein
VGSRAGAFEIGQLCSVSGSRHFDSDTTLASEDRDILHMTLVSRYRPYSALPSGERNVGSLVFCPTKFGSFKHHSIGDSGFKIPREFPNHRHLIGRDTLEALYRMVIVSATRLLALRIECNV